MTTITDGSAQFALIDRRMKAIVDMFYPVGSVYLSADSTKTKSDFAFMAYGTWEEIEGGRCLEVADSSHAAGSTVDAGLPDIQGTYDGYRGGCTEGSGKATGAFTGYTGSQNGAEGNWGKSLAFSFKASKYNSIYGSSNTVQPPAYFVKAWRRTA